MKNNKYSVENFLITYSGNANPIAIKIPLLNGKPFKEISFGFSKVQISSSSTQPLGIKVINCVVKQLVDVFNINGQKHNLVLSMHNEGRLNNWYYSDDLADQIKVGKNEQQLDFSFCNEKGQKIIFDGSNNMILSFSLVINGWQ